MVQELRQCLLMGKIDKVQQPTKDELVISVHSKAGNKKLYASVLSSSPRVHLINEAPVSPPTPFAFCMLMRKHLVGARILDIQQYNSDRIIEISMEALNELGFTLSKKLIIEIMGKHSNIILVDIESGNVIDSIKRVSFDTSRVRQILPGIKYSYPPSQNKTPFDQITKEELDALPADGNIILKNVGGISLQVAEELAISKDRFVLIKELLAAENVPGIKDVGDAGDVPIDIAATHENSGSIPDADTNLKSTQVQDQWLLTPHVYLDADGNPLEFHIADLSQFEESCSRKDFDTLSEAIDYYFEHKDSTNRMKQVSHGLARTVDALIEKSRLKLQRLNEDLLKAEDSEKYRLYGELLTANLHAVKHGAESATVTSYYDGESVTIPLDPKYSPSKNAQNYFKKYGKSKTAVKEKQIQIEETGKDIEYLESVAAAIDNLNRPEEIELIRSELIETGYIRKKKTHEIFRRFKVSPTKYTSPSGFEILVGKNNKENDELTLKIADKQDLWFHTKNIPGSHVILRTAGEDASAEDIYFTAAIAAWFSKARSSGQVPVDYVKVRHVKKPAGAKPGMVIFTDNRTVYVEPKIP